MAQSKEFQKSGRFKRQLIRFRQNLPSGGVLAFDKLVGTKFYSRPIPYYCESQRPSPSFFILGSGRSGNTLLRRLLVEEFDTFIPPEIPGLGRCLRGLVKNRHADWETYCKRFFRNFEAAANISVTNPENGVKYNLWAELQQSIDDLDQKATLISPNFRSGASLVSLLYQNIMASSGYQATAETIIGDKTPWNVMYTRQIDTFFPQSRFVYIVRHPLAVAFSYFRSLSSVNGISLDDAAHRWSRAQHNCLDLLNRVSPDRMVITKYETLVTWEEESRRVGQFLMLPHRKAHDIPEAVSRADSKLVQHKRINQRVDGSSIDLWKTGIDEKSRKRLLRIVEPAMERLANEVGIDYRETF